MYIKRRMTCAGVTYLRLGAAISGYSVYRDPCSGLTGHHTTPSLHTRISPPALLLHPAPTCAPTLMAVQTPCGPCWTITRARPPTTVSSVSEVRVSLL
jgi:hypothetical protein